jgi:hypothetical protein
MARVFSSKKFLREVITDFQALLSFMDVRFGRRYAYGISYSASAGQVEKNMLTIRGTMIYFFIRLTNRPYPTTPTSEDIKYINAIWDTLGYPEKKLAT